MARINSVDDLNIIGCMRLAKEILLSSYNALYNSYVYLQKKRKYVERIIPIIREWDNYQNLKKEYKAARKIIHKNEKQQWIVDNFPKMKKPVKPSVYQIETMYKYFEAEQEKAMCEMFYKSERYQRLTLGKGIPGDEVIEYIRKKAKYGIE